MRFLITGHTGFKGAWLALWLAQQGHEVHGFALDPLPGGLFDVADVTSVLASDHRGDVRNAGEVHSMVLACQPEAVLHLAAQPLVRESYRSPRWTFETNAMGTLSVLEAVHACDSVRAHVVVTTDKVYRNVHQRAGYVEDDALGGEDPYSASKAMADILTHSWIASFGGPPTAIARAGNVIGSGDVSQDRLLPDVVAACLAEQAPVLRYPHAVRPWQHVLDCINGYLMLVEHLLAAPAGPADHGAWNFAPDASNFATVGDVTSLALQAWGTDLNWVLADDAEFREAELLALDANKASRELGWHDKLSLSDAVTWTVEWHQSVQRGERPRDVALEHLARLHELSPLT